MDSESIRIEFPTFDKQDFIRVNMIRWEIYWIKHRKRLKYPAIAGFVFFGIGLLDKAPSPGTVVGSIFLGLALIFWLIFYSAKRQFKKKILEAAGKYNLINLSCSYEFSNDSIKYQDNEKELDFKWNMFTSYSIYKDFLVLTINNSMIDSYLFEKKDLHIDNYNKILELVKTKLEFKEIK